MKEIWNEKIEIGRVASKHYQESTYSYDMGRIPAGIYTVEHVYEVSALAVYDKTYGVLRLTLTCIKTDYGEFMPSRSEVASHTELQQFGSRENAIRWLIDRVEKFKAQMIDLIPPTDNRSNEDVERAYYAEIERRKRAKAGNNEGAHS